MQRYTVSFEYFTREQIRNFIKKLGFSTRQLTEFEEDHMNERNQDGFFNLNLYFHGPSPEICAIDAEEKERAETVFTQSFLLEKQKVDMKILHALWNELIKNYPTIDIEQVLVK